MLLPCYITLFVPEYFISFSVSHDCVTCDCGIYNHSITYIIPPSCFMTCVTIILHFLPKSKIKKIKRKAKNKNKRERK